ncbi:MAG: phosphoglycerate dehydrogenase, partial [Dorea sp.]
EEDGNIAKDAEKAKKAFAGCELQGKKLGVIGLGAIGVLVANAADHLGMDVYGYDPYVSVDSAWRLSRNVHHATNVDELYEQCDYITIHVPALDSTKGMISRDAIGLMKKGVVVLNFARNVLVDEEAMVDALVSGHVKHYVTDFPTPEIAGVKGAIVIPHLGASTEESEDNCAKMAVKELMNYLENGNIKNSVNYPDCDMGLRGNNTRILLLHHNVPNMIGQFTKILARDNMNIADLTNKSKGKYAYTMIDVDSEVPEGVAEELRQVNNVLRVRVIS